MFDFFGVRVGFLELSVVIASLCAAMAFWALTARAYRRADMRGERGVNGMERMRAAFRQAQKDDLH
jgi:hypothetical protein